MSIMSYRVEISAMKPIEIVEVNAVDLRAELEQLATREGYASPEDLRAALRSGEVGPDSWAAWEYRGITRMLSAQEPGVDPAA